MQKIVAVPYYVMNIRASIKLADPIFFDKTYWRTLMEQSKELYGEPIPAADLWALINGVVRESHNRLWNLPLDQIHFKQSCIVEFLDSDSDSNSNSDSDSIAIDTPVIVSLSSHCELLWLYWVPYPLNVGLLSHQIRTDFAIW